MTDRKWTPGPWRVFNGEKVIAAAPDLYEALAAVASDDNAMNGPVLFASDASAEALKDAKGYIARYGLTRDDVSLRQTNGQTIVMAKRDCREKLVDTGWSICEKGLTDKGYTT